MQARISILLDRDYHRIVPKLHRCSDEYQSMSQFTRDWDWTSTTALDLTDCHLTWIMPMKPGSGKAPFGVIGFQWNPKNGENQDATGFVLPGIRPDTEKKFLSRMEVEPQVIAALGPRPQVFVYTASRGLLRAPVPAQDGNNRMISKEKLLAYICDTLGFLGFVALQNYWGMDVFND